jgi:hypothetical protein
MKQTTEKRGIYAELKSISVVFRLPAGRQAPSVVSIRINQCFPRVVWKLQFQNNFRLKTESAVNRGQESCCRYKKKGGLFPNRYPHISTSAAWYPQPNREAVKVPLLMPPQGI